MTDELFTAARRQGVWRTGDAERWYGRGHVRAQLDARRWQQPAGGIIVEHNGPLTESQRTWVVVFAAPPGTLLHGLSAATHDGLRGIKPDKFTIVIPGSANRPDRRAVPVPSDWDVALRWSTKLEHEDVNPAAIPPRTRLPRSAVDAASERVAPKRVSWIVISAVQQRLTTPQALWDSLSRRGRCRNRKLIAESIVDAAGGIQSLPEAEFDAIRRQWRLPQPDRQAVLQHADGRYFLDSRWDKYRVSAEIHGIPHMFVQNWDSYGCFGDAAGQVERS